MNDLSLHILDILQNSVYSGANNIILTIEENLNEDYLIIIIEDNGKGMSKEVLQKVTDPWFTSRTTRKVGMGIPLYRQTAVESGGELKIDSEVNVGTKVTAKFVHSHIDRPPLGDVANVFILTASSNLDIEFSFKYIFNGKEYNFNTAEVKDILEETPFNDPQIIKLMINMIKTNMDDIKNADF